MFQKIFLERFLKITLKGHIQMFQIISRVWIQIMSVESYV